MKTAAVKYVLPLSTLSILVGIIICGVCQITPVQALEEQRATEPELFYYYFDEKIPLTMYSDKIGIYFVDGFDASEQLAFVDADPELYEMKYYGNPDGLAAITLSPRVNTERVLAKLTELAALPEVRFTSPFLATPNYDDGMMLMPEFSAAFEENVSREEIDTFNATHGVEITGSWGSRPNMFDLRLVNPEKTFPLDMLDMVNAFHESPLTAWAAPDFAGVGFIDNVSPSITIMEPQDHPITIYNTHTIRWTDDDPDDDAQISLYYNRVGVWHLIQSGISEDDETDAYIWDVSNIPQGTYTLLARINDWHSPLVDSIQSRSWISVLPLLVGDVDLSRGVDAVDVQHVINAALGMEAPDRTDIDDSGSVTATDIQLVINAALGL